MPSVAEMFPSKFLVAADLPVGQITVVEILGVELSEFSVQQQGGPPGAQRFGRRPTVQAPEWVMWFREYQKPMRFKQVHAHMGAELLGTDDTDEWVHHRIGIFPTKATVGGKAIDVIGIDMIRPGNRRPQLAQTAGPVRGTDKRTCDMKAMGQRNAAAFQAAMAEQGATFDDALRWLKANDPVGYELAHGKAIEDLPRGLAAALKGFLAAFTSEPTRPVEPTNNSIDFNAGLPARTGVAPAAAAEEAEAPKPEPIQEDDIPF
jgi:hypothetical protein